MQDQLKSLNKIAVNSIITEKWPVNQGTLKEWLRRGPFTLTMSSGFFSFFAHCGMLSALEEEGLVPSMITGSSAGGMIGVLYASGLSTETIKKRLFKLVKSDFWDPSFGFGLLKGCLFRRLIKDFVSIERLEDCNIPVAVSVFDVISRKTHVLAAGSLSDAVYATCAVPFLFQPIRINGRYYLDGGLKDRHGLTGAWGTQRIFYHHIVSRSPWRSENSPSLNVPDREGLVSLSIDDLPRVSPGKLESGKPAYEKALIATRMALNGTIKSDNVKIKN